MPLTPEQVVALRLVPLNGLPNKLRLARQMLELKAIDVAAAAGFTSPQISDLERGDYKDIPLENTRALAEFFGAPIEVLFPAREREEAKA